MIHNSSFIGKQPSQSTSILTNRYANKGTCFTMEEREALDILGRLPMKVETLDEQVARCYSQFKQLDKPINMYQLLHNINSTNTTLYYALICKYPEEMLPIIYTPTVGEACQKFGSLYQREHGMYVGERFKGMISKALSNARYTNVDIIVVTDGSRILGLGDLGANGMGISIGKCSLYVVGAGLHPRRVLPIMFDVGTNNEDLLTNPTYLGNREKRCADETFYSLMDEFMDAVKKLWPTAVVQFEDFSNNHCFDMLDRYRSNYRCFNDDIQGTGAVVAAGFGNAVNLSKLPILEQRVVVFGAGSAAVGVVNAIASLLHVKYGVPTEKILERFYLVDTKGLVTDTRGDKLASHKVQLSRKDINAEDNAKYKTLEDIVKNVKPTALLGLGGVGPVFTKDMVEFMCTYTSRPIIFPLSNPTSKAEIIPENAYQWSKGTAIVASGSPFPSTIVDGKTLKPSQGNNMYIFPGVGLGCSLAQPDSIPESVMVAASKCLMEMMNEAELESGALYPPIIDIRKVSGYIARAVIKQCVSEGIAKVDNAPTNDEDLLTYIEEHMWKAVYSPPGVIGQ